MGGGLLCFTRGASCAYGLLCAPFQVHSTCIVGRTVVIRDTDRCILGSESQRTGWDVGLAWIASGGILVRCRGSWGGGGCTPASAMASNTSSMASSPASSVHALFTTRTPACRYPKWLRGTSGLKGVHLSITSLLYCMGIRMDSAKWRPTV